MSEQMLNHMNYAISAKRHTPMYLTQPEIDFLHGRTSASIFMQNYFNPALISDLKERVFKAIEEIKTFLELNWRFYC